MRRLKGEGVAAGIALGPIHLQGYEDAEGFTPRIPTDQVESEMTRLQNALATSRVQIDDLRQKHGGQLGREELQIFDTHIGYLSDPKFVGELETLVQKERMSVRASIKKVVADYERIFQLVENEYLRQRAGDFRDVATRVLRNLGDQGPKAAVPRPTGRYVLAARQLTTTDMFDLDNQQVEGIVAEEGGISSHAGILARSMGIPTITGIRDLPSKLENGEFVILDGSTGEVLVQPDEGLRAEYEQAAVRQREAHAAAVPRAERSHETRDGTQVRILASCGNLGEVELARTFGMDGVGLFRTELLFLMEKRIPSEDALTHHYREVARQPDGHPVQFRLLDIGSTTPAAGITHASERNPALGRRGVRTLLEEPALLRLQLRAILRATAGVSGAALLVPFVSGSADVQRVKAALIEERQALRKRKEPVADHLELGAVVEVPAAALNLKALFDECDLAVVAIDDLQAHLMAADRDNQHVRDYYSMPHPALFELLAKMAREAIDKEKRLVLFGESAADPLRLPFYIGVGYRSFSVAPVRMNGLLKVLRRYTLDECQKIANEVLEAPRSVDVQRVLVGLGDG